MNLREKKKMTNKKAPYGYLKDGVTPRKKAGRKKKRGGWKNPNAAKNADKARQAKVVKDQRDKIEKRDNASRNHRNKALITNRSIEFTPPMIDEILSHQPFIDALQEHDLTIKDLMIMYHSGDDGKDIKIGSILNIICDAIPNPDLYPAFVKRHQNDKNPMAINKLASITFASKYGYDVNLYQYIHEVRGLRSPQDNTPSLDMNGMLIDDSGSLFGSMPNNLFTL